MGFDILIIIITLFFIIRGWIKGFIEEALNLLLIIVTLYLSLKLRIPMAKFLDTLIGTFYINKILAFIVLVLGFSLISAILKKYLLQPLQKVEFFSMFDKIFGAFTGFLLGCLVVFGISYFVMFFLDPTILQKSKIFPIYDKFFNFILKLIQNEVF